jgi:hypothetical protein
MPTQQQTDRTFERAWAWVQGIRVADGLRRLPSAVRNNTVLRSWRKSTHQVNPSVETANDELLISGGRRGTV